MENMPLISVIIPVYKVEKYLNQCIDSVLCQTFENFEVILVDDGSPDNSGKICDEYAKKDNRVRVFHKENGGLSDTRNFGIKESKGEYLIFLDSDDFYNDNTFFEAINEKISKNKDVDLISFSMRKYFGEDDYTDEWFYDSKQLEESGDMTDVLAQLIKKDQLYIYAWDKVVKRELIIKNNLYFRKGMRNDEDTDWTLKLLFNVDKYLFLEKCPHMYRRNRKESITNNFDIKGLETMLDVFEKYCEEFKNSDDKRGKMLLNYLAYRFEIVCGVLVNVNDKKVKKEIKEKLKSYKWILEYNLSCKVKKAYFIYKIFGFSAMVKVLGMYIKYR